MKKYCIIYFGVLCFCCQAIFPLNNPTIFDNDYIYSHKILEYIERSEYPNIIKLSEKLFLKSFEILALTSYHNYIEDKHYDCITICGSNYYQIIDYIPVCDNLIFSGGVGAGTPDLIRAVGVENTNKVYLPLLGIFINI